MNLSHEQWLVLGKVLRSEEVQLQIGAQNWDLTEDEEEVLWSIINKIKWVPHEVS